MSEPLSAELLRRMDAYWRAANYLSVGQIYLYDNALLLAPLKPEDIKPGRIEEFTFDQSAVFPGTTRKVTVFIPAQYDAAKPADNGSYNAAKNQ